MIFVNRLIPYLLAVLVALGGQTAAAVSASSSELSSIVICSGDGPKTIVIDNSGQPTRAVHFCFDCCFSNVGITVETPKFVSAEIPVTKFILVWHPLFRENRNFAVSFSRGPPVLI